MRFTESQRATRRSCPDRHFCATNWRKKLTVVTFLPCCNHWGFSIQLLTDGSLESILAFEPFTAVHQQVGRHQFTGGPVGNGRGFSSKRPVFAGFCAIRDGRVGLGYELAEITRSHVMGGLGAFSALGL